MHIGSREVNRASQCPIRHPRIDLCRRDLPVPERPLDHVQIAGLFVEPGGEGVAERVDRNPPVDADLVEPLGEPQLDLPGAEAFARVGLKQRADQ